MIADFAKLCEDEENLRELYLLTFCDLSSVAPDNLTGWKESLLKELFQRTRTYLRRGGDLLGAERKETVKRRQQRAEMLLAEDLPDVSSAASLFRGFPDRYFAENEAGRIATHIKLMRARREADAASIIKVAQQKRVEATEMVLAAVDVPGLLAEVAGVLHANRIDVLDAAIYSRDAAADEPGEALDIFLVRDGYGRAVTDEGRWRKIREDLEAVISGRVKVETLVAARAKNDSVASWKVPEVPTEIKIDNQVSRDFTVVELITGDRPGVLYAIARTLFDEGLDIHRSKIATEANRVVDTFYLRDKATGAKVTDEPRMKEIREALRASLPGI
jgi:[protein-PII] uridylyltransferase